MKLYLIRHGQTDWNVAGKIQGRQDIPLNKTGLEQAELLAEGMKRRPVSKIFSSTLERAVQTASAIGRQQNAEIYLIQELAEVDFGQWEGMTWNEIQRSYPKEYERWCRNPVEVAPPGGENQTDILKRCISAVKAILAESREDVAIVSHGATLAHIIAFLLRDNMEADEIIVENASITTINYSPLTQDFMLLEMDDTSHLNT